MEVVLKNGVFKILFTDGKKNKNKSDLIL
jgi:hypothetical protein